MERRLPSCHGGLHSFAARIAGERGSVIAAIAIFTPVLVGLLGLVIDNGLLYSERRKLQAGADSVALSAIQEIARGNADYKVQALKDASEISLDASTGTVVTINRPPLHGVGAGKAEYVEVIAERTPSLLFMRAFGLTKSHVVARAVAAARPQSGCIFVLNKNKTDALNMGGGATLEVPNCTIMVNSAASEAAVTAGSSSVISKATNIVGGYGGTAWTPKPAEGIPPFRDPLARLEAPPVGSCQYTNTKISSDTTLKPGVYCGGITVQKGKTTLGAGNYILVGGGLTVSGNAALIGTDVFFYNTYASSYSYSPIVMDSTGTIKLEAPRSGTYKGILFFGDRRTNSTSKNQLTHSENVSYRGTFYFPTTIVKFVGGDTLSVSEVALIVDSLEMFGKSKFKDLAEDVYPAGLADSRIVE